MPKQNHEKATTKKVPKRRLNSVNSRTKEDSENVPKRKKTASKPNPDDTIAVSKQLSAKLKNSKRTTRSSNRRNEPKICINGKPMPPLAELEKMFDDSDTDEEPMTTSALISASTCQTPSKQTPVASHNHTLSPTTVKKIATKLMDKISNISDPTELLDLIPPPPVVPQKKPKKSEIPYIIGCKDRPQVIKTPNTNFCKGDDYGIDLNATTSNDDGCHKKRRKTSKSALNISKSIFNAQSDDIVLRLMANDNGNDSDSSIKTVAYQYYKPTDGRPRGFSPLPSTSKDNKTIMKNEKLFNESFTSDDLGSDTNPNVHKASEVLDVQNNDTLDDVQIVETPCETIVIDDVINENVKIIETHNGDDTCVLIVEPEKENKPQNNSIIDVDDYYSSLNIDQNNTTDHYMDDGDIIDVDNLIAENKALIKKYHQSDKIDKVTLVGPSCLRNANESQTTEGRRKDDGNAVSIPVSMNNNTTQPHAQYTTNINNNMTTDAVIEVLNQEISNNSTAHPYTQNIININNNMTTDAVIEVLDQEISNNITTQHHTHNTSNINNNNMITDAVIEVLNQEICVAPNTQPTTSFNHTRNNNHVSDVIIAELNKPCAVLSIENVRKHDELEQRNRTKIKSIVSNFFNNNKYVDKNTTPEDILATPQSVRDMIETLNRRIENFANHCQYLSDLRTRKTIKDELSRNVSTIQTQKPAQPPAHKQLSPKKNLGDCPICMDSLSNNAIASTICGHLFCMKCIQAAFKSSGKKCPTCRKTLKANNAYHQIFI